MRVVAAAAAVSLAGLAAGCGYIASPLPPLANLPARVQDLAAIQRGQKIIAQFTLPTETTEGLQIPPPMKLDLRIGPEPDDVVRWATGARPLETPKPENGILRYEIPAMEWVGQDVGIRVRAIGANGKTAGWSNVVKVSVVAAPETPADVQAQPVDGGVKLTWQAAGAHFRVLRATGKDGAYAEVASVTAPPLTDTHIEFGTEYTYLVQTFQPLEGGHEAQSELSAPAHITPAAPPPATPQGLRAVPGSDSIELAWDAGPEPNLAGYTLYRATGDGPMAKIAEIHGVPAYSDRSLEHGKTYRYTVAALAAGGQESAPSAPVPVLYQ